MLIVFLFFQSQSPRGGNTNQVRFLTENSVSNSVAGTNYLSTLSFYNFHALSLCTVALTIGTQLHFLPT